VAKYLKHLVAESSKPLPALGLMLDCRLKFNCLITGAIKAGNAVFNLQSCKFPASFPYAAASLLSVSAIIYRYKESYRNAFLEHVGRNSIFYYAGQGVASSIIYYGVEIFSFNIWSLKLLLMFLINVILTVVISEGLRYCYKVFGLFFGLFKLENK
jgi:hypothetical protein